MTNLKQKLAATLLTAFVGVGLAAPVTVQASEAGHRTTAISLGTIAAYFLQKKELLPAVIAGAGAAVAYKHSTDETAARHKREQQAAYAHAYRSGYGSGHIDGRYAARQAYYRSRATANAGRVVRSQTQNSTISHLGNQTRKLYAGHLGSRSETRIQANAKHMGQETAVTTHTRSSTSVDHG